MRRIDRSVYVSRYRFRGLDLLAELYVKNDGRTAAPLLKVCQRAGELIHIPANATGKCCGQAFASKGFLQSAVETQSELLDAMWEWGSRGSVRSWLISDPVHRF